MKVIQEGNWSQDAYVELEEGGVEEEVTCEYWTRGTAKSRYSCRDTNREREDQSHRVQLEDQHDSKFRASQRTSPGSRGH